MFTNASNPISSYKKVAEDVAVESADGHQLIVLLFQGASQAIAMARLHMQEGNLAEKGLAISKAIDIINLGLKAGLDMEAGGEIAQNLVGLYNYMVKRLIHANIKNQVEALDEVTKLLDEISSAWIELGKNISSEPPASS